MRDLSAGQDALLFNIKDFNTALSVDLGLVAEGAVGRDKRMAHAELPVSVTG